MTGSRGKIVPIKATRRATPAQMGAEMDIRNLEPASIDNEARRKFRTKYTKRRQSGCWEWKTPDATGYGMFHFDGESYKAHRVGWTIHRGAIPEGMVIDHLCRNTRCVNPDHLEPVTHQINWDRAVESLPAKMRSTGMCQRGHDMSQPEAWYVSTSTGRRYCLECRKARNRESARRHAERQKAMA